MIFKVDHFVITTANLKSCTAFYQLLGFEIKEAAGRYELFNGDFKINVHILGQELSPHAKNVSTGSADVCFELILPLEEFQEYLQKIGIEIALGIVARTGVNGRMRSVYIYDPDGNLLEFCSYK